jgi:hypothetical protein
LEALNNYLLANKRLTDCLKTENYLDKETREDVYDSLFTISSTILPPTVPTGIQACYSYAEEDIFWVEELDKQLTVLKHNCVLQSTWHKAQVLPGDEWSEVTLHQIRHSKVILLMVSVDFIASEHTWENELQAALERHQKGEAIVIPIIVRDCLWRNTILGTLSPLPKDGTPLASHPNKDEALREIAEGIYNALLHFGNEQSTIGY